MKDHHQYIDVSKLDKLIKNNYAIAYMNDAKWNKLIQELTNQFEQIYPNYKLIHSGQVKGGLKFLFYMKIGLMKVKERQVKDLTHKILN